MDLLISRRKVININFNPPVILSSILFILNLYTSVYVSVLSLLYFFFSFISSRLKSSSKIAENESNVLTSF